jgi:DNA-binding HxlR family transcriptional regulator
MTLLGDRWMLAILAQVFLGARRFGELQENLGIPRAVLSARLSAGEANGLLERRRAQGERHAKIFLTERGRALWTVMVGIMEWGNRFLGGEPPVVLTHAGCGGEAKLSATCERCGERIAAPDQLVPAAGPAIRPDPAS